MKITDYLKKKAQSIARSNRHFKDPRVFDFNYIPDQPLMREEVKPIIDAGLRYLQTGIANHLFIYGARGTGKTLAVKYIGHLLTEQHNAKVLYSNCRQYNTSFKILANLLRVRPRGYSLEELWQRFCESNPGKIILMLDECDLLSDKDKNREILYLISRMPNNYMVIMLSNHPKFLSTLDESIRSTLQPEIIHFRNYNALEISEILQERARLGLTHVARGIIPKIAALTVRATNSDVRVAIKTLYYAALKQKDSIEGVFDSARRDLYADVISNLNTNNIIILKSITSIPDPFVKSVYEIYKRLSIREHEEPFSYPYFHSNLSFLQSIGLIALVSTKVGRTYSNRIERLFDAELFNSIWEKRFDN